MKTAAAVSDAASEPTGPLISVVIPCYNYAQYVAQAIASVTAQAYGRKEIVVVNDGSTDDSLRVISRCLAEAGAGAGVAEGAGAQLDRVIDQANQGSVAAYNNGFAASRGDVVIFLDADDLLAPGALASIAAAWRPDCVKVQYDLSIIDGEGIDLGRRFCNFAADYDEGRVRDSFQRTGTYRWPVTAGNAYSRWFLQQIFPLAIEHGPDGTLNTVAPVYGDVVTIPRPLACYRIHGANMWASDGLDQSRLPYRIRHRRREVAFMRAHAARRGVALPPTDVLDHELPFLGYRLMALKLGLAYESSEGDTAVGLVWRARAALRAQALPWKLSVAHLSWFVALALAPRPAAGRLIRLRFNRAAILQPWRQALARAKARFAHAP